MTEKEVIAAYAEKMGFEGSEKSKLEQAKKCIDTYLDLVVGTAMETGSCTVGKIGAFKRGEVAAKPAKLGVKNALTGGTYDVEAKPARTKLLFSLSKAGKRIGL